MRFTDLLAAAERGPWALLASPERASAQARRLATAAGWLHGREVRPTQAGLDDTAPWLESLDPATARSYVRRLREAMGEHGEGLEWPVVRGTGRARGRALTREETRRLLEAFPDDLTRRLARWLFLTGCRPGEALGMIWTDLDAGVWRVRGTKTEGSRRSLPLEPAHLSTLLFDGCPHSRTVRVWPITEHAWRSAWREAVKASGLEGPDMVPYVTRHTFATRALERGMTEDQVAAWLGHTSSATVRSTYRHAVAPVRGVAALMEID